nr:MAG: hypothetical protein [Microviridae sp.]
MKRRKRFSRRHKKVAGIAHNFKNYSRFRAMKRIKRRR